MKKLADFLFKLWFVLLILLLLFTGYHVYSIGQENKMVETKAQKNTDKEGIVYAEDNMEHPFILEGDVKTKNIAYAASYYYALPEELRRNFAESGWRIILTDEDISKEYYDGDVKGHLAGLTVSEDKKIYVHDTRSDIRRALIHEFGHFFDFQTEMTSKSFRFTKMYWTEKEDLKEKWKMDDHATSNSQEYFAESFAQFVLYPGDLKENCPQTYKYLKDLWKSYSENDL